MPGLWFAVEAIGRDSNRRTNSDLKFGRTSGAAAKDTLVAAIDQHDARSRGWGDDDGVAVFRGLRAGPVRFAVSFSRGSNHWDRGPHHAEAHTVRESKDTKVVIAIDILPENLGDRAGCPGHR